MLRLILAEALLLGLVGCGLGVMAGLELSFDGVGLWKKLVGYTPPLDVPWDMVWLGVSIILGVAFLASLWPAVSAAREEPLSLLQAGRAGT
jgi:putative ABC transport system permease protein